MDDRFFMNVCLERESVLTLEGRTETSRLIRLKKKKKEKPQKKTKEKRKNGVASAKPKPPLKLKSNLSLEEKDNKTNRLNHEIPHLYIHRNHHCHDFAWRHPSERTSGTRKSWRCCNE